MASASERWQCDSFSRRSRWSSVPWREWDMANPNSEPFQQAERRQTKSCMRSFPAQPMRFPQSACSRSRCSSRGGGIVVLDTAEGCLSSAVNIGALQLSDAVSRHAASPWHLYTAAVTMGATGRSSCCVARLAWQRTALYCIVHDKRVGVQTRLPNTGR